MEKEAVRIMDPIRITPVIAGLPAAWICATGQPVVHNVFTGLRVPHAAAQIRHARLDSHLFCIFRDLFRL
ncbi:MAG TPA: hypothetical protein DEB63_07625 [Agrobacterium sp.]|nr:hypothetical protein [Agrobacterium sp.]HCD86015.1 hypothetical protein [Agrobacterium sp.]